MTLTTNEKSSGGDVLERPAQRLVDGRTPTTMWELLIWAYKRQMVRYEVDRHEPEWRTGFASRSATCRLGVAMAHGGHGRGAINGAGTTAHEDAHVVHAHVMQLEPSDRDLIIRTAERGLPPDPNPVLPPWRVVPVRKGGTGSIRMLYGKSDRPIACLIDYEGVPEHEAQEIRRAACEAYSRWWHAVRCLGREMQTRNALARWRVVGIGAEREPLLSI